MNQFAYSQDSQPFYFQTQKLIEALDYMGNPILVQDKEDIRELLKSDGNIRTIQVILEKYVLFDIQINLSGASLLNQ